ncbi:MAG: methyltransferase domain-containing protein [Desulfobacterales bacterium]|nr:methyltransferase domain-containing protein [Desulfobacterales bacterium]
MNENRTEQNRTEQRTEQRTTEWIENVDTKYHERQFKEPHRSTIAFCDWLEEIGYIQRDSQLKIIDIGSGSGANIYYMGKRYPNSQFIGMDINSDLVTSGNQFFQDNGIENCQLIKGDIYNLSEKYVPANDAIVSFQTLSWLPEFKKPIASLSKLKARWIALSSLFYDGPLSCTIEVQDYDINLNPCKESFYNVYSLPVVRDYLLKNGYPKFQYTPFEIDIDLPRPSEKGRGTYTEKLKNGNRLQISGPLLMPWYFIAAEA